ncbi:MAG: type I-C CRISPR-associated protein Cas5c [Butyrivibrio sp.]|nr:type I-C CRISPR-associated protein Cas5c [Acetatifactor muris]MCM1558064.1 type I-C CRISPR-associated protein Cas5c [Butyrivibrio sp.]
MSVMVETWGKNACFSRPEMKTERVSYDIITPSAARGLLEAIYWHPGLNWVVDKIYLMAPIQLERQKEAEIDPTGIKMTSVKRNEVKSKISASTVRTVMTTGGGSLYLNTAVERNQRSSLILQDVHYVIEAHFDMTPDASPGDNQGKFQDIMKRRLRKGQCYHQPYFGCREFPAHFREWEGGEIPVVPLTKDFGYMLHSMDYDNPAGICPRFFRAQMKDGVLDLRDCEVVM